MVSPSGNVVIYSGDDERFEYAYKFVTAGTYDAASREANLDLLDDGTLYVARFNDDGTGKWLPLTYGENGLDEAAGFATQADVLDQPAGSSDVLGATKMDRPEDFETNPVTGKVYLVCTNNSNRGVDDNPGTSMPPTRASRTSGATSSRSPRKATTTPPPPSAGTSSWSPAIPRTRAPISRASRRTR